MVSGILLILSIIDSVLAAPLLLVQEKRQTCVDAVMLNIPKDVITVLAKRGEQEDLAMLVEKYIKKLADSESSGRSSSAPPRPDPPDLSSTEVPQAPPVNLKHLMNIDYDPPPAPVWPPRKNMLDFTKKPKEKLLKRPKKPKPTEEPSEKYWAVTNLGDLLPKMEPPKDVGQAYLLNKDYPPPGAPAGPSSSKGPGTGNVGFPPKPAAPKKSSQQAGPMLPENMLQLNSKPTDEPSEKYWSSTSLGDLLPKMQPPKGVGQAHESQDGQQPNAGLGPSDTGPSNLPPTTALDSSTGLGVNRPLPPPTDSERATMGYRPPSPPAEPDLWKSPTVTPTEADSYYPGWVVYSPLPGTWSPAIPEHGMGTPPHAQAEQPSTPGG